MRTTKDRIRHTLGFEIVGLILFVPLASSVSGFDSQLLGSMAVVGSIIAMLWNYFYNWVFDRVLLKLRGELDKTVLLRILHAFMFECGLLSLYLPLIAWYLHISLWSAFMMGVSMATFYLVYAFFYNLSYDKAFPISKTYLAPQFNH